MKMYAILASLLSSIVGMEGQAAPTVPGSVYVLLKPPALAYTPLSSTAISDLERAGASHAVDDGRFTYVVASGSLNAEMLSRITGLEAVPMPHAFDIDLAGDVADIRTAWPPNSGSPNLRISDYPLGGAGLYVIKYAYPPKAESLKQLDAIGLRRLRHVSWNAYIVAAPAGLPKLAAALPPEVIFVSPLHPYYKISPSLRGRQDANLDPILVDLDPVQAPKGIEGFLRAIDKEAILTILQNGASHAFLHATPKDVETIAQNPGVVWIERTSEPEVSDERASQIAVGHFDASGSATNPAQYRSWLSGLCGGCLSPSNLANEIVDLLDLGISSTTPHQDLNGGAPSRLAYSRGCCGFQSWDVEDTANHGTIVAGILGGDPQQAGGTGLADASGFYWGTGVAPGVKLGVTHGLWANAYASGYIVGPFGLNQPSVIAGEVSSALALGARYQNNSWNMYDETGYNLNSQKYDQLVRDATGTSASPDNPMTIVFATGNIRPGDTESYVKPPATAKNVITVGASGLERSSFQAAGSCNTSIKIWDVASLSRRRTQGQGQFKPDLIAPGRTVTSTRSYAGTVEYCDGYTSGSPWSIPYGLTDTASPYIAEHGTSFSAPQVTGATVLIKRFLQSSQGFLPTPAMTKAVLVGTAASVQGGTDWFTGYGLGWEPSIPQGWGRLNIAKLLSDSTPKRYFDEDHQANNPPRRFTASGGYRNITLSVADPSKPVIVAMAYTDAPSTPGSSGLRVNGVDMYVLQGSGVYCDGQYGTQYTTRSTGCWLPDMVNNVKRIVIAPYSFSGGFTVQVVANGINQNAVPGRDNGSPNQDWALFVYNAY